MELVGEAYSFEDLAEFRSGVLDVVNRVVPADRVAYNEIGPDDTLALMIPEYDASLMPRFSALHENPLISHVRRAGDGRLYRISDTIDKQTSLRPCSTKNRGSGRILSAFPSAVARGPRADTSGQRLLRP